MRRKNIFILIVQLDMTIFRQINLYFNIYLFYISICSVLGISFQIIDDLWLISLLKIATDAQWHCTASHKYFLFILRQKIRPFYANKIRLAFAHLCALELYNYELALGFYLVTIIGRLTALTDNGDSDF